MNTTQLKEYALLAEASYAKFSFTDYGVDTATKLRLSDEVSTPNGTFSVEQAKLFTERYTLLHQSTENTLDGFSATVFQDKDNPNRLILSFRGTEFVGDKFSDLALTDSQIGLSGYAAPQAVPLYRYIRQLQTVAGQAVNYTETEMQSLFALSIGGIVTSSILLNTPVYTLFKNSLLNDVGINAGQPAGTALFVPGMEIDVAGHSLGGHLAMLAQRLFPGLFDDVVTVNAVGFYAGPAALPYSPQYYSSEAVLSLFGQWDNSKILRMESVGDGVSELAQIYPGATYTVGMETRPSPLNSFSANHSVANIADGLALTSAIGKLDARYMADPRIIKPLFNIASNEPVSTYESLLDGLRNTILGGNQTPTGLDNLELNSAERNSFYINLTQLQDSPAFRALIGQVTLVAAPTTAEQAHTDFGAFLSLYYLTPFTLHANNASVLKSINSTNQSLGFRWENDNSPNPINGEINFTDSWFNDRIDMLNGILQPNINDTDYSLATGLSGIKYTDIKTGIVLGTTTTMNVVFGSSQNEIVRGVEFNDRLYGGEGDDVIYGNGGNDYIEGGTGFDYLHGGAGNDHLSGGDGSDILDGGKGIDVLVGGEGHNTYYVDGGDSIHSGDLLQVSIKQGSVNFNGVRLTGGTRQLENEQYIDSRGITYSNNGGDTDR